MGTNRLRQRVRRIRDLLVASERFTGSVEEVPARVASLREALKDQIDGDAVCLFYILRRPSPPGARASVAPDQGRPPLAPATASVLDIEICFPIRPSAGEVNVSTRILEGGQMLCVNWAHPERAPAPPWGFTVELQGALRSHMDSGEFDLENEPVRQLPRALPGGGVTVETQISLLFPRWLDRFRTGVVRHVRNPNRAFILRGEGRMGLHCSTDEQLAWVTGAIERLESTCQDPAVVRRVLQGCSHRVPPERIAPLRSSYQRAGDLDAVVTAMPTEWLPGSNLKLTEDRFEAVVVPADREAYEAATTDRDRRVAACYRTLGQKALRDATPLPRLYCYCCSGWFLQLWEGILRRPVEVEVAETVLWGQNRCRFVVHLPPGVRSRPLEAGASPAEERPGEPVAPRAGASR